MFNSHVHSGQCGSWLKQFPFRPVLFAFTLFIHCRESESRRRKRDGVEEKAAGGGGGQTVLSVGRIPTGKSDLCL